MSPCQQLQQIGQSLWLDNITRGLLNEGVLRRYINDYAVTGLTSNPTIFDEALGHSDAYDADIASKVRDGITGEALFMQLALDDLRRAADLFAPTFSTTAGVDGWVSMEVSPLFANDTSSTINAAKQIHAQAGRDNLYVKIPGTPAGVTAIEECIFAGVPINVTLLFSRNQYIAAAEAYLRGIERRIKAGLDPHVSSVASLFVSRWDKAVASTTPAELHNRLGIAIAQLTYNAYRELLSSSRWQALAAAGAKPQRLLWASTGVKDPAAPATLYVEALAAPDTINTMPEGTLQAFADHGEVKNLMSTDLTDTNKLLAQFAKAGVDTSALELQLQRDGANAFVKSWQQLMQRIDNKVKNHESVNS